MTLQLLQHPAISLAQGHGLDLPMQAARTRASWMAGRQGRPPVLLVAMLWARHCADVVQVLERHLDALFADYPCTPEGWSEAQAARQVLAAFNQQLFRRRQGGAGFANLSAGLLLVQGDEAQFLQVGAIGLLRYHGGALQSLVGREGTSLGAQPELALVQHSLPLSPGGALLLAPQPLLEIADLQAFRSGCQGLESGQLEALLEPLLKAPGAATLLLPGATQSPPAVPVERWPALSQAESGMRVDGWTLLDECPYGPPGRLFKARDKDDREALLWLAASAADEAFWQREWVLRRSPVASLPQVLSAREPRRHAFLLFEPVAPGMRSLTDWVAEQGRLDPASLLPLLRQLVEAVRALQRRGMQGLWLSPRQILLGPDGQLLLLPELAAILPGVDRQALPADGVPLAPELRAGEAVDGRADQFALAALAYWLLAGRWPEVAQTDAGPSPRYARLAVANLPRGWDGVLARALAPRPEARFEELSEFLQGLESGLGTVGKRQPRRWPRFWYVALLSIMGMQLIIGFWFGLFD